MRGTQDMLQALMAEDFAVYETALYLDGHPEDERALTYLREHRDQANALRAQVERAGYPLTFTATPRGQYAWVTTPWPWQKGGC